MKCTRRTKAALGSLHLLVKRRSQLSAETKVNIYKVIIRPLMTYASSSWVYAPSCHIDKLVQNKALRQAVSALWYVPNLQIQNKALRQAQSALWCIPNLQIYSDLETSSIAEFIQYCCKLRRTSQPTHQLDGRRLRRGHRTQV